MPSTTRRTLGRTATAVVGALALVAGMAGVAGAQTADRPSKPAVVRERHHWLLNDEVGPGVADQRFTYGTSSDDVHVMGDWDGDGVRTPGVIRFQGDRDDDGNTDMVWYLRNDNSAGFADIVASFGERQNSEQFDTPIVGDWDGDGDETIGVVRADYENDAFLWLLRNENSSGNAQVSYTYGRPRAFGTLNPGEPRGVPVVGDWDGDGVTTPGVIEYEGLEGAGTWLLNDQHDSSAPEYDFDYGTGTDNPIVGDWDGDGDTDPGVHRRLEARWLLRFTKDTGVADQEFRYGTDRDKPVVWR